MTSPRQETRRSSRARRVILALAIWAVLGLTARFVFGVLAAEPASPEFLRTWQRTDAPVKSGQVSRTWMWGDGARTGEMSEPYDEAPGGQRMVQYYDKSRMEDNRYRAGEAPWDVTNGLLVVELVTGRLQLGDNRFEQHQPAAVNVAGDRDDPTGPQYQTLASLLDVQPVAYGSTITQRIDRAGNVTDDPSLGAYGVTASHHVDVPGINHHVASPFWTFMNASGSVYEQGSYLDALLFLNPFYATGYPITEPYWANVKVAGTYQDVLLQCFERRCLTYTPGNDEGWQVEAGNVGLHYYEWRYGQLPGDAEGDEGQGTPEPSPTATTEEPGGTATQEPTVTPTETEPPEGPEVTPTATEERPPEPTINFAGLLQIGGPVDEYGPLDVPLYMAAGPDGALYVADNTDRILKYSGAGSLITTWNVFDEPTQMAGDLAVDDEGNVYVAGRYGHGVEVYTSDGQYKTGWEVTGCSPGVVMLNSVAVDRDGLVYLVDQVNSRILKYSGDGTLLDEWGKANCQAGTLDGEFDEPEHIAISVSGAVYIADNGNERIQVLDTDGDVQDVWEDAGGLYERITSLALPRGSSGVLYATASKPGSPTCRPCVQKFNSSGSLVDSWGDYGDAPGQIEAIDDMTIGYGDKLYIADGYLNHRIQAHELDGAYLFGWSDHRRGRLASPTMGMALDTNGDFYLSDDVYDRIQVFDLDGYYEREFGEPGPAPGQLDGAVALEVFNGIIYAVDTHNDRVLVYRRDGEYVTEFGSGYLNEPYGIAVDQDRNIYVANAGDDTIRKFDSTGAYLDGWGGNGDGEGQFKRPTDIAITGKRMYVVDSNNNRIQVFDLEGGYLGQWGEYGEDAGQYIGPVGIDIDRDGNVYVIDAGNHRVQVSTFDGDFLATFGSFGAGNDQLQYPSRVDVDDSGIVYILDTGNNRVQVFQRTS